MPTRSPDRTLFLSDVLIAAAEGGVNHWANVGGYVWSDDEPSRTSMIVTSEDDERSLFVSVDTIATGIAKVLSDGFAVNGDILSAIREGNRENDAGIIDATAADVIVQAGLFGEIVYG